MGDKKTLWILEDRFSQNWGFCLDSVTSCVRYRGKVDCLEYVKYDKVIADAGNELPKYGYIVLDPPCNSLDVGIVLGCRTKEDFDTTYDRICDALLHHPECIDLRGIDLIYG